MSFQKYKASMGDSGDALQSIMVARRLASICPTSISIDDLKAPNLNAIYNQNSESKSFIPPTPVITKDVKTLKTPTKSPKTSRFTNIISKEATKTSPYVSKLNYSLPNVHRLTTSKRTTRPLMVVSLSNLNLNEASQKPEPEPAEQLTGSFTKRVDSVDSLSSVDNI